MTERNYTTTIIVDQSPAKVFAFINNVRGWWSEKIEGCTDKAGEIFKYHFRDLHRREVRMDELIPGKKVAWTFADSYLNFTQDAAEWKGIRVVFDIARKGARPSSPLSAWCQSSSATAPVPMAGEINGSLKDLITTSRGQPNKGEALTESEQALAS